ncbi:Rieske 2Fe-2S domain-containing protein [Dactylosporangium sp. NPDC005572]|uniref:Rieske 2Fe-2S domain-containing protein n=1 Tax=Dactylosporangium sp. NPDC005572 TaxID=3156889 RepID=UPI0033BC2B42
MTASSTVSVRAYGTGWYHALYSGELPVGVVKPLRYFGRDIVAFRAESGKVYLLDAHCQHMGAHLGYGGAVNGDNIVCPYHNWQWRGSDGANAAVPGLDRCIKKSLGTWRTHESDGIIYLWFSRTGDEEPSWLPPTFDESADPSYYPLYPHGVKRTTVNFPPQFAFENVADISHMRTVHGWVDIPVVNAAGAAGPMFFTDFTGAVPTRRGPATVRIENFQWGLGLVYSRIHGLHPTVQVSSITPIDQDSSIYALSIYVGRVDDDGDEPKGRAKAVIEEQARQALNVESLDRQIWDHQMYVENAPLVGDERATIGVFRRWSRQFREDVASGPSAPVAELKVGRAFPLPLSEFRMEEYVAI